MIYAIKTPKRKITTLRNPMTKKLGERSMEIYLSHMVIYRALEKVGVLHLTSLEGIDYLIATVGTVMGTIAFAAIAKKLLSLLSKGFGRKM